MLAPHIRCGFKSTRNQKKKKRERESGIHQNFKKSFYTVNDTIKKVKNP